MSGAMRAAGEGRQGPSVQEVLATDRYEVPAVLREACEPSLGDEDLAIDAYTSPEHHRREVEKVWRRAWQVACREEDLPRVGDRVVYDVGDDSLVVVRAAADRIRAFHNACLHRGTRLCDAAGSGGALRCPFQASPGASTAPSRTSPPPGTSRTCANRPSASPRRRSRPGAASSS
jgi:nitrite reductase/ring-hydroxylating ferredoxin subunit